MEWRTFHITYTLKAFISGCGPVLPLHFSRRKLTFHYTVTVHLIVPLTNLQLADGNLYFAGYFNHQATERVKAKALRWQIIIKIELHFPVRLFFFKAEEMLVIDFYRNESLFQHVNVVSTCWMRSSLVLHHCPFCISLHLLLALPQTHSHSALLPLLLFPNISFQLCHAPLSVTGIFSTPHIPLPFPPFPGPWAVEGDCFPEDASPLPLWDRRPSAVSFCMEHLWVTTQDTIMSPWRPT